MNFKKLLFAVAILFSIGLFAQENHGPTTIIEGTFVGKTIPLRDMPTINETTYSAKDLKIIENNLRANEKVNNNALPLNDVDLQRQKENGKIHSYALEENFDGLASGESGGFTPPDPTGAVGPNHYVAAANVAIKIFDKSGTLLVGPTALGTFMGTGNNSGDPIIMYDQLADRYFVSQFGAANNSLALGVSETNDPTGSYFIYTFSLDAFPDYPHYSIWHDGYYFTANKFSGNTVYSIERDVILAGGTNPKIVGFNPPGIVSNNNTVFSPEFANLTGTNFPANAPAYLTYLQDDGWAGVSFDHLKVWEVSVDWNNIGNSTISTPQEITIDPFNSVFAPFGSGDLNQPGTGQKIDMIGGVISYAANYRTFGDHNSWVITFNVDIDGNDTSGVRWIELRNDDSNPWSVFQEGTYAPADGNSRFMGSAAMDAGGNIGLAFNIGSASMPVGIRYTGRYDGDALGQMTVAETTIVDGGGVQTFSNRFGDYSHLTIDPDNFTFWHTAEYFTSNNNWQTRVASFSLSGGFAADVGISNIVQPNNGILTNSETVEVSIRNFGTSAQSNIPIELRVDGNLIASETYGGTIAPNDVATYTFTQTVDLSNQGQTYSIEVKTNLGGDEFNNNDAFTKEVTYLLDNDMGTVEITSPETGTGLGIVPITATFKNFGAVTQSNFDVQYTINGGTPVVENFASSILSEEEVSYTFSQTADLSALGTYTIAVKTSLSGDGDTSNDEISVEVENQLCHPMMDCSFGDGFQLFSIQEINNASGCEGYADFTDQIANLEQNSTYNLTVTTGYGDQYLTVWIDFNDDFDLTDDEKVVTDYIIAPGQGGGSYTETTNLVIPTGAALGEHLMRAKTNWQAPVPDDSCEETQYGETEDYTANIGVLSVDDFSIRNSDLIISSTDQTNFDISLQTNYDGKVYVAIYNMLGQQLGFRLLSKVDNSYQLNLDMGQAASGIYLIKVGGQNTTTFKTGKIIVK
ncbi:MAG: GEVED domain-containing protein [Flavobacteriales bacterium]